MAARSVLYRLAPYARAVAIFITIQLSLLDEWGDWARWNSALTLSTSEKDTFDFIIVGSGSSGSVLAARLSDHFNVLLLEAGGNPNPFSLLPIIAIPLFWEIREDWKYETVPLKFAGFGQNNNVVHWPSGKALGGSSTINGMLYARGNVQGFNVIAEQSGDKIWRLENVLKYYKKIEDYQNGAFDDRNHGKGGRIFIQKSYGLPYVNHIMRAGQELGYNVTDPNPNGPLREGFAPQDQYVKNGLRWSAYNGYIQPNLKKSTLAIRKFSYVYKVILDENNVATGVEYLRHGKVQIAKATKEVILSAGAVQTPKILMLSGLGPRADLERIGIRVRLDLPVGQSLQDKYGALVGPFIVDPGNSFTARDVTVPSILAYLTQRTGLYSSSLCDATYTISSQFDKASTGTGAGGNNPDIHSYLCSITMDPLVETFLSKTHNFRPEILRQYFSQAYGKDSVTQFVNLGKPYSQGTVKLRDADPLSPVVIDPNYLQDRQDVDTLVEGIKFSVKVMEETKAMKEIHAKLLQIPIPGCEHVAFRSDAYWECYARHMTVTAYKYCSTAPIGKNTSDPIAVVDSRLRVFGAKRLRVIDASVLREKLVSVTHATCTMLGELASDFILEEHLRS